MYQHDTLTYIIAALIKIESFCGILLQTNNELNNKFNWQHEYKTNCNFRDTPQTQQILLVRNATQELTD